MAYVGTPRRLGDPIYTLASVIQGEAASQGRAGMQAVASVMQNRAKRNFSGYGRDVLTQALAPNQFQGQAKPGKAALDVARQLYEGGLADNTRGAIYYANPGASTAKWARRLNADNSLKIGAHYFTDNANGVPFRGRSSDDAPVMSYARPTQNPSPSVSSVDVGLPRTAPQARGYTPTTMPMPAPEAQRYTPTSLPMAPPDYSGAGQQEQQPNALVAAASERSSAAPMSRQSVMDTIRREQQQATANSEIDWDMVRRNAVPAAQRTMPRQVVGGDTPWATGSNNFLANTLSNAFNRAGFV